DGHVVIAAITSCTNTSNPSVMIGAGLLARNAVERGLSVPPWVKTSLAPGSLVVTDYYERAGLLEPLAQLGFQVVRYRCPPSFRLAAPQSVPRGCPLLVSVLPGQPQLRGSNPPRLSHELPRVTAARRRVCDRGIDGRRPAQRSARHRRRRQRGVLARHLAE